MTDQDVTIVGGGMVGAAAAALLGRAGFQVALVDPNGDPGWAAAAPVGLRVSALSPGSEAILEAAGAWGFIRERRHAPYRRMRVEDGQGEGRLDFEAAPFGHEHLGTIVENDLVATALWRVLDGLDTVETWVPCRVETLERLQDGMRCRLADGREVTSRLVVACDGPRSRVRAATGLAFERWSYNQKGVVGRVRKSRPNPGVAWQRFLPGGPLALLPLEDGWSSMVWTLPDREADTLLAAPGDERRERIGAASDGFLGSVELVDELAAFPLTMGLAERFVAGRVVLLGDAAHVVHPLAGQGVNLGLADAAALVETLLAQRSAKRDLAEPATLDRFDRWRRSETELMAGGVHALGALFRPGFLSLPRGLGMRLVNGSWNLRETFLRRAAGQGPNAPRLARGEPLEVLGGGERTGVS